MSIAPLTHGPAVLRQTIREGRPFPLGATWDGVGVNFALFSANATKIELCIFDTLGKRELERITQLPPTPPKGFDNFDQWLSGTQLERELKLQEYSVSNRGLRPNLVGTPEQIQERIAEYQAAGLDLLLLQMSPQAEEMDRFAAQVIAPMRARTPELV